MQRFLARIVNPLVVRLAPFIPFYAVLEHRGRKSGRIFRNPLAVVRTQDGFLLPLAFGEGANWVRNVRAAGGGALVWRRRRLEFQVERVITWDEGTAQLNFVERTVGPVFGARHFLVVRTGAPVAAAG